MVPGEDQSRDTFRGPIPSWSASDLVRVIGGREGLPSGGRLSHRVAQQLKESIRAGTLLSGAQLPPSRALAEALGVSRGVIVGAYEQLLAAGFLTATQGSGTRIADAAGATVETPAPAAPPPVAHPGLPNLSGFPRSRWLASYRYAVTTMSSADFAYADPRGHAALRVELADHLRRTRGAVVEDGLLLVVNGVAECLSLLSDVLIASGRRHVAVEDPASPGTRTLLERRGLTLHGVAVDDAGLDVDELDALTSDPARRIGAVVVTPAHQYPTGVTLTAPRRQALIDLARQRQLLIIEDDYDGAFHHGPAAPGCVQGLAPDVTVLLGSVSKTLAPALRLGWMVAPRLWSVPLVARRQATNLAGHTVDELAFAHLLAHGHYDRHVRAMRRDYDQRRSALTTALACLAPDIEVLSNVSGLHLLATFPHQEHEPDVVRTLQADGFDVQGLTTCFDPVGRALRRTDRGGVVLGYAALGDAAVHRIASTLGALD